jgi:hypothetical protein
VFFKFALKRKSIYATGETISARTKEMVVVKDKSVEFKLTDNTSVVRVDGTSYTGALSGLFENQ